MKLTISISYVRVIGHIWQPGFGICAMEYRLNDYHVGCARETTGDTLPVSEGPITRESLQRWIDTNTSDFSSVEDWSASIENNGVTVEFDWEKEDSEVTYWECIREEEWEED
jgi:hypothetical protein